VAGIIPNKIASATAVGGPNTGSPVADAIKGVSNIPGLGPLATPIVTGALNGLFTLIDTLSGEQYRNDSLAGMEALTAAGSAAFTQNFPGGMPAANNRCGEGAYTANGVRYYSWGGTGGITNALDISDYALAATKLLIPEPSDGLVGRCSSHLGMVIRDNYNMNHLDEVNMLFGLRDIFSTDPVSVYRQQANRLKTAGL
jgi:triacylglycerol lipase